jgi:hypothetical protein
VLEFHSTDATVIAGFADRSALDGVVAPAKAVSVRIAPDEVWWVGAPADRLDLLEQVQAALAGADALVVDQTDGWDVWTVRGDDHLAVLDRLMLAPIPAERPAFVQGAITGVPGKVLAVPGAVHLFVPGPVGHHLRDRILSTMADLAPAESKPRAFAAGS